MFYKYLPTSRLDVLKNLKIRFSQPQALNDPFETCRLFNVDEFYEKQMVDCEIKFQQFWEEQPKKNKIEENYGLFKKQCDVFKTEIKEKFSPDNTGQQLMKLVNSSFGVLSLSRTFNNLLMWSHYAQSHEGFVIGFDDKHDFFYQKSNTNLPTAPHDIRYTSQRSQVGINDLDLYKKILCEKPTDWAYEEEVRIFRVFTNYSEKKGYDNSNLPIYLVEMPPEMIKQIYIGSNMTEKNISKIGELVKDNNLNVQLYKMKISNLNYEIEYNLLNY